MALLQVIMKSLSNQMSEMLQKVNEKASSAEKYKRKVAAESSSPVERKRVQNE